MSQVPILIISDAPDQSTGLSRICRDLATLLSSMIEFRVATLGYGGRGSVTFPWQQYQMYAGEFGNQSLAYCWDDFSRDEPGVVMTIFDVTRLLWLARPEYADEGLREWLLDRRKRRWKLWGYIPVDATGPRNRLSTMSQECLLGFDRLLSYSPFGEEVIRNTIGNEEAEKRGLTWCPHGIGMKTFAPVAISNKDTRVNTCTRVGIVSTNQVRKDFGLAGAVMAGLVERLKGNVRFWIHVDQLIRHWSIPAIIADYGLGEYVEVTQPPMSDRELAERYRACDLTLHPGAEGFGFPLFESLACGVPAIHGDYAGGASIMRTCGLDDLLVQPVQWRLETQHNCVRPVYDPADWVKKALQVLSVIEYGDENDYLPYAVVYESIQHLDWMKLGHVWKKWAREGLGHGHDQGT